MSAPRPGTPGATRECAHCKETVLESATVCPACRHHLRFDPAGKAPVATATPLHIEGNLVHPDDGQSWEYTVVVSIRNQRGEEIARRLVGVGAMAPNEQRSFSLSVEMGPAPGKPGGKGTRH